MTTDGVHTLVAGLALLFMAAGASMAWGLGYAMVLIGGLLLVGVIYARIA